MIDESQALENLRIANNLQIGNQTPTNPAKSAQLDQTKTAAQQSNILHNFTSYTYKISLFLLTSDDYNQLVSKPSTFNPKYLLISSGGGIPTDAQQSGTVWHPDFQEDFYFDNLVIKTVVGLNSRSKASNMIDIKFSLIEPYGMSLLDRLLSACQVTCDCPNYADQPYLLQIDFLSNPVEANTFGITSHLIDRKRVAIKFNELKIKPGVNGTTYNVSARPYNHTAFDMSSASVPVNLSVEAKTVGDYFDSREELQRIFDQSAAKDEERLESEINKARGLYAATSGAASAEEAVKNKVEETRASAFYTTKSYPAGFNTYYKNVAYQEGRSENPLYQILFNIHPDIANSPIIDTNKMDAKKTVMNDPKNQIKTTTAEGTDKDFKNKGVFMVNAGTDVVSLIDRVLASSEYTQNQIVKASQAENINNDRADSGQKFSAIKWYKIIPTVNLGLYDKKIKSYSKVISYSIIPYNTGNFYHPDFPQTKLSSKKCVRTYNYYYTGLNTDIIQLDIDFDATYFTAITTFARQLEATNTSEGAEKIAEKSLDTASSPDTKPSWLPKRIVVTPQDTQQTSGTGGSAENAIVGSVARSLYSSFPRGDMLNIRVRIVGDPAFIKQDDALYQPTSKDYGSVVSTTGDAPINETGQIIFDNEEVYVQLIVKGAIDIDDTTGITNKIVKLSNGQSTNGSFSGLYKVQIVTSEFSKGKFEQTVEMIRVPDDLIEGDNTPSVQKKGPGNAAELQAALQSAEIPQPPSLVAGRQLGIETASIPGIQNDIVQGGVGTINQRLNQAASSTPIAISQPNQVSI